MGRPKGGKNRSWTKEEKLRIVRRYFDEKLGRPRLAKEEGVSSGMLYNWITKFLNEGEDGLDNMYKGNSFAALHTSKSLSEVERLRLVVEKQTIEIERLKKGYVVRGDGANKGFVTIEEMNLK